MFDKIVVALGQGSVELVPQGEYHPLHFVVQPGTIAIVLLARSAEHSIAQHVLRPLGRCCDPCRHRLFIDFPERTDGRR